MVMDAKFMCRTTMPTKTYCKPTDIAPVGAVIQKGVMFIATQVVSNGSVTMFKVSQPVVDTDKDVLPFENWVSSDVLEYTKIEDEIAQDNVQFDDSVKCDESLLITGEKVTIYKTTQASTPVSHGLKLQDFVIADKKINVNNNGTIETRYHIADVQGAEPLDRSVVDCWILGNYSVFVGTSPIVFHNTNVSRGVRKAKATRVGAQDSNPAAPYNPPSTIPSYAAASGIANPASPAAVVGSTYAANQAILNPPKATDTSSASAEVTINPASEKSIEDIVITEKSFKEIYESYGFNYDYATSSWMNIPIGRMTFVHGMPFQFDYLSDRRNGASTPYGYQYVPDSALKSGADMYGRIFAKEIAANMPIATIVPGIPEFLTHVKEGLFGYMGTDKQARNNWVPLWGNRSETEFDDALKNLIENEGKNSEFQYFSMRVDCTEYFTYVNALCQTAARLMGIGDVIYRGKKCSDFNWADYNAAVDQDYSAFEEVAGIAGGVSFAFDPLSSITDSLSNSTTDSEFSNMLNGITAKMKELDFIGGTAGITLPDVLDMDQYDAATIDASTGPLKRIQALGFNAMKGMNVRFPQIWQDSQSSKSYDIDMKFISPYATNFCKWRYVLVPFFHLFCLAAPRSDLTNANYERPFLIRAFSKGYFNVEMGMIESIQWKRFGDGDMISEDGVPTEIDVSISFQDLYQQLAMSRFGKTAGNFTMIGTFFNNTGLMDMVGTLSGVNMNKISLSERISLYASTAVGAFAATGSNFMGHINDRVRNIFQNYLYGL